MLFAIFQDKKHLLSISNTLHNRPAKIGDANCWLCQFVFGAGDRFLSGAPAQDGRILTAVRFECEPLCVPSLCNPIGHLRKGLVLIPTAKREGPTLWDLLFLVPVIGVEPIRYRYHWILSPARLPIPSHRHSTNDIVSYIY